MNHIFYIQDVKAVMTSSKAVFCSQTAEVDFTLVQRLKDQTRRSYSTETQSKISYDTVHQGHLFL